MRFHTIFRDLLTGLSFRRKIWESSWVEFDVEKQHGIRYSKKEDGTVENIGVWSPDWADLMTDDWVVCTEKKKGLECITKP